MTILKNNKLYRFFDWRRESVESIG